MVDDLDLFSSSAGVGMGRPIPPARPYNGGGKDGYGDSFGSPRTGGFGGYTRDGDDGIVIKRGLPTRGDF